VFTPNGDWFTFLATKAMICHFPYILMHSCKFCILGAFHGIEVPIFPPTSSLFVFSVRGLQHSPRESVVPRPLLLPPLVAFFILLMHRFEALFSLLDGPRFLMIWRAKPSPFFCFVFNCFPAVRRAYFSCFCSPPLQSFFSLDPRRIREASQSFFPRKCRIRFDPMDPFYFFPFLPSDSYEPSPPPPPMFPPPHHVPPINFLDCFKSVAACLYDRFFLRPPSPQTNFPFFASIPVL